MAARITSAALAIALAAALTAGSNMARAGDRPRLGVGIGNTSNSAGVVVTSVEKGSPATDLDRLSDDKDLDLAAGRHIITHVNGQHVGVVAEFQAAIASSPKRAVLKVYDIQSGAWDDYRVSLRGNPTRDAVASSQGYGAGNSQGRQLSEKEAKKERSQRFWAAVLLGTAAALDGAAAGMDSYSPPASYGGNSSGLSSGDAWRIQQRAQWDSFNRNYSRNPDHASVYGR
jgi:hypothetical protein